MAAQSGRLGLLLAAARLWVSPKRRWVCLFGGGLEASAISSVRTSGLGGSLPRDSFGFSGFVGFGGGVHLTR